ncbi:MAG: hypothetical protein ABSC51_03345 [Gaiellaceae bacterium]|jgi:uncharacterized membrane protein
MSDSSLHPLARAYLKRLKKAAKGLSRARRKELIGEIELHLREALAAGASDAEALNVLERLGEPAEIVAAAGTTPGQALEVHAGKREWLAIALLLIGGFVAVIGWLAGVALLWRSRIWTLRDKLIGTLVLPGGLLALVIAVWINLMSIGHSSSSEPVRCFSTNDGGTCLGGTTSRSGPANASGWLIVLALFTLPFFTSAYLAWRANRLLTTTP